MLPPNLCGAQQASTAKSRLCNVKEENLTDFEPPMDGLLPPRGRDTGAPGASFNRQEAMTAMRVRVHHTMSPPQYNLAIRDAGEAMNGAFCWRALSLSLSLSFALFRALS